MEPPEWWLWQTGLGKTPGDEGLGQRSPTFLAAGTGFVEDSFSTDWWVGPGGGMVQAVTQAMVQAVMRAMGSGR